MKYGVSFIIKIFSTARDGVTTVGTTAGDGVTTVGTTAGVGLPAAGADRKPIFL